MEITSTNYNGSVDTFELANQYSSFTTSQVGILCSAKAGKVTVKFINCMLTATCLTVSCRGQKSDILVASDYHGLHMGGGAGDNVLVGADGAQHFKVGYGHDVIKNFNSAEGDISSHLAHAVLAQVTNVLTMTEMLITVRMRSMYLPMARH